VKILLERNDVNPDSADKSGRTPLSWAAEDRCKKVVRVLLERNDVNPSTADEAGRTPLSWAAGARHLSLIADQECEITVKMLLERNEVDPDGADKSGRTPLSWAAEDGCKKVVRVLLERNDVNPHSADKSGRTPSSWAAKNKDEEFMGMLGLPNWGYPGTADKCGPTSYIRAIGDGYGRVAEGQAETHGLLSISGLGEEYFAFRTDPFPLPEPPSKRSAGFDIPLAVSCLPSLTHVKIYLLLMLVLYTCLAGYAPPISTTTGTSL